MEVKEPGFMPDDLIPDIFLRLPVKSLARFRSVCKTWNNIIKNPNFAISHYTQHSSVNNRPLLPSLLVVRCRPIYDDIWHPDNNIFSLDINTCLNQNLGETVGHVKGKFIPFSVPDLTGGFRPIGSCHGIICIYSYAERQFYVWNPHTRQCGCVGHPKDVITGIYGTGFCFVPSINDYKIVLVTGGKCQIFVYSLRADSWPELDTNGSKGWHQIRVGNDYCPGYADEVVESVRVNDALYWFGRNDSYTYILLKFDLINDEFDVENTISRETTRKKAKNLPVSIGSFGEDKLCVCLFTEDIQNNFETCVMEKEYGIDAANWDQAELKSLVNFKDGRYITKDLKVLRVASNGKVLIMERKGMYMEDMLIVDGRQEPVSYIRLTNEYILPHKRGTGKVEYYVMSYVPSLISPFSLGKLI